jgi:hypothetical protein
MTLADVTFYLFSFFNSLRIFSYLPQIHRVARDQNGAAAISYWTWALWAMSNASTGAYALVSLGDRPLAAISTINTACCAVVIGLTAFKRCQLRQDKRMAADGKTATSSI